MGMPIGIEVAVNRLQEKLGSDWKVKAAEEEGRSAFLCVTYIGRGNFEEARGKVLPNYRDFNVKVAEPAAK